MPYVQYLYHNRVDGGSKLKTAFLKHENSSIVDACSCKQWQAHNAQVCWHKISFLIYTTYNSTPVLDRWNVYEFQFLVNPTTNYYNFGLCLFLILFICSCKTNLAKVYFQVLISSDQALSHASLALWMITAKEPVHDCYVHQLHAQMTAPALYSKYTWAPILPTLPWSHERVNS